MISKLCRKSQIFWTQRLKEHDITAAEYPILIVLNKREGITQDEIALELGIDKSAITRVVRSLLEKDYIKRRKDEKDQRCNRIYLTEKGHESWIPIKAAMQEWNEIMTGNMKVEEVEKVNQLLSQMATNIEGYFEKDKGGCSQSEDK